MKHKIGFRLDWLETVLILVQVFFAGLFINSDINDKFIYTGLLLVGAGILLMKRKIRIVPKR